jgi:DUF4097 and DUF4098 domain-containing protein YvlB
MSHIEERMLILKMLEEGKITSEQAAQLIEALDAGENQKTDEFSSKQSKQANFQDEINKLRDRVKGWKKDFKNNYNQSDFDHMVEDFASKAEKLGKNVASTTFGIVDRVIDFVGSYVDTNSFNIFGKYTAVDKTFEIAAKDGMTFSIEGINGNILVKKHLDNKILIKTRVRSPLNNADGVLILDESEDEASLTLNKAPNMSVSHEVFIPAVKFKKIKIETSNGKIYVEDSMSEEFESTTRNSHIELMGVNSDKIAVNTKNAKIQVSYVIGRDIEINTNNSVIDIKHIKAENLKAYTMNGRISVENAQSYEGTTCMNLFLKTSNGGIKINMNDMDSRGYKVKAKTTNGGINLLIPEMTYHNINRQGVGSSFVEAESNGYDSYPLKAFINAETINGYIEVVK